MGILPDVSPYGSQTVTGPGWPNVEEETLAEAAGQYEQLAAKLTGSVVPLQQSQLARLAEVWTGGGAVAAAGEATSMIGGHEANAAHAAAIAGALRSMEATVVKTKALVNTTALETQQECEALAAMPVGNTAALVQSRIKLGMSQNMAFIEANTAELAAALGVATAAPMAGTPPTTPAQQAGQDGSQQGSQMLSQMASLATQLPGQLMGMLGQAPQQLMAPLQTLAQPLQQLTSMLGGGGKGAGALPFSAFSAHPLAGGAGAGGGAGLVRAASLPGAGGSLAQTSLMSGLVGSRPASVAPGGAAGGGFGGTAPVGAGVGGMGGAGMMGQRGVSGGTAASLAVPEPLEHDVDDDADDDW